MKELVSQLYSRFPREFAHPQRQKVNSLEELLHAIDQYNGVSDCFVSLYPHDSEGGYAGARVNKVVFDFDGAWDHLVRFHHWLDGRGWPHFVVFSGSDESGHVYVLTEPTTHHQSVEYLQRDVCVARAGLRTCPDCNAAAFKDEPNRVASWVCSSCGDNHPEERTRLVVDDNLIGDPSTHIRIPNTWHPRAERFCIPLLPQEITGPVERVYEKAQSQRDLTLEDIVCCREAGPVEWDAWVNREQAEESYRSYEEKRRLQEFATDAAALSEFEADVTPAGMMESLECECVRSLVLDGDGYNHKPPLGHHERRILISALIEKAYNPAEINRFLQTYLDEDKARHSIVDEEQPMRCYRDGVKMPRKTKLKRSGVFRPDCPVHAAAGSAVEEL